MNIILGLSLAAAMGQLPDREYKGPAYAERTIEGVTLVNRIKGTAMVLLVQADVSRYRIESLFGTAACYSRDNLGPIECWWPELGVTAYFPGRNFGGKSDPRKHITPERVKGGIQ